MARAQLQFCAGYNKSNEIYYFPSTMAIFTPITLILTVRELIIDMMN